MVCQTESGCVLLLLLISGVTNAYNCTGKPDGVHEANCQSFTRCDNGVAKTVECHKPQVVNEETGQCDSTLNVKSPCGLFRDCSFRDDGRYADTEYQCQWYFTCTYGIFYGHSKCAQGLVWDTALQTCDYTYNVAPPCGTKTT